MPVSVNAALRESLAGSEPGHQHHHPHQLLQSQIASATKHLVLKSLEYEEYPDNFLAQNENLKSKYILLSASNPEKATNGSARAAAQNGTNGLDSSATSNGSPAAAPKKDNKNELPQPKRILFPRDNIKVGWKASERKWNIGAGFSNVGNTCYLNSTLQALFHVPAMANWLVSDTKHREESCGGGDMYCTICAVFKTLMLSQSSGHAVKPVPVFSRLRSICKHMVVGRQEDAHEFLRYLIEAMEKAYMERFPKSVLANLDQYSKETTPLNQILGFYLRSNVRCLSCGHNSITFQHFEDLLLDIRKSNTVDEALQGYFAREKLEDMDYTCSGCKKKVTATKQFSLERPPVVLCIQLKRFTMQGNKLNKHVSIKAKLDLTPYVRKVGGNHGPQQPLNYRLVSMVTHLGSSQHCGHYTAIGVTESGSYYQFDDSSVHPIALQNVLQTNAYIIFYELENAAQHRALLNGNSSAVAAPSATVTTLKTNGLAKQLNGFQTSTKTVNGNGSFIGPVMPPNHPVAASANKERSLSNGHASPVKKDSAQVNGNGNGHGILKQIKPLDAAGSAIGKKYPSAESLFKSPAKQTNGKEPSASSETVGQHISPRSLVPYNSNLSSDDDDDEDLEGAKEAPQARVNGNKEKEESGNGSDSLPETESPIKNGHSPPAVVNSNSGVWKVCSNAETKKGVVFKGTWKSSNQNGGSAKVLNELLKQDHSAYGGVAVSTWSGEKSNLDKEISAEKNLKRSSDRKADDDEMDRGHIKKMKYNNKVGRDNPGFNAFQEHENRNQQQQKHGMSNGGAYRPQQNQNHCQSRNSWVNNDRSSGMGPYNPKYGDGGNNKQRPHNKPWRSHNGFKKHNFHRNKGHYSQNNNNNYHRNRKH